MIEITENHLKTVLKRHKAKNKIAPIFKKLDIPFIKRSAGKYESPAAIQESIHNDIEKFLIEKKIVKNKLYDSSKFDHEIDPLD